jgi:hypothetical protein
VANVPVSIASESMISEILSAKMNRLYGDKYFELDLDDLSLGLRTLSWQDLFHIIIAIVDDANKDIDAVIIFNI